MVGGHVGDVPLPRPVVIQSARGEPRQFYVRMAYACAAVAFVGFTPTYWAPVATRAFSGPPILHLHGLLFSAWTVLFIVQARLAASGNLRRHRALGLAGVSLATAMLFAGIAAGCAVAFAKGKMRSAFVTAAKLETTFDLPVIGTISLVMTDAARALARKRRKQFYAASGSLGGLFVILMAAEFIQRGMVA